MCWRDPVGSGRSDSTVGDPGTRRGNIIRTAERSATAARYLLGPVFNAPGAAFPTDEGRTPATDLERPSRDVRQGRHGAICRDRAPVGVTMEDPRLALARLLPRFVGHPRLPCVLRRPPGRKRSSQSGLEHRRTSGEVADYPALPAPTELSDRPGPERNCLVNRDALGCAGSTVDDACRESWNWSGRGGLNLRVPHLGLWSPSGSPTRSVGLRRPSGARRTLRPEVASDATGRATSTD